MISFDVDYFVRNCGPFCKYLSAICTTAKSKESQPVSGNRFVAYLLLILYCIYPLISASDYSIDTVANSPDKGVE